MKIKIGTFAARFALALCGSLACSPLSAQNVFTVAGGYVADGGPATSSALSEPNHAAYDAQWNLYITDQNNHRVRKVDTAGNISTVAGNGICGFTGDGGPASHAEICAPTGLAVDSGGNILFSDSGNLRIRKIDPTGKITTVVGNGTFGYCGDGGPAINACLTYPQGIALLGKAGNGILYIADAQNNRIRQVNFNTGTITTIAGNGTAGYTGDGGRANLAELNYPISVAAYAATQTLWITDQSNVVVRKVDTLTGTITTFFGKGICGNDMQSLCFPGGVAVDKLGNLEIADTGNGRILRIAVANGSNTVTVDAGAGAGFNGDGIPATSALLLYPNGTAFDRSGNLLIVDGGNNRIRKGRGSQTITTMAGGYVGDGAIPTKAAINGEFFGGSLAFDPGGTLYIADSYDNRVRKVSGGTITTFAGTGISGHTGDGGPATSATLYAPTSVAADGNGNVFVQDTFSLRKVDATGTITTLESFLYSYSIAVDPQGNLYAADFGNCVVRKYTPNGTASIVAGTEFQCGESGDGGPATAAKLLYPTGVAADASGNIYIGGWEDNRIRKVDSSGTISTAVGNGTCGFSGDGGPATAATVCGTLTVSVDAHGNLYIADTFNERIRKVSGGIITTIAGPGNFGGYNGNGLPALQTNMFPTAVAVSPKGVVHYFDVASQRIRKIQ